MESDDVSQPLDGGRVGPGENPVISPPPMVGASESTGAPQLAQKRAPTAIAAWHRPHTVELVNTAPAAIISGGPNGPADQAEYLIASSFNFRR
jgi:hypothetical protein